MPSLESFRKWWWKAWYKTFIFYCSVLRSRLDLWKSNCICLSTLASLPLVYVAACFSFCCQTIPFVKTWVSVESLLCLEKGLNCQHSEKPWRVCSLKLACMYFLGATCESFESLEFLPSVNLSALRIFAAYPNMPERTSVRRDIFENAFCFRPFPLIPPPHPTRLPNWNHRHHHVHQL